MRIVIVFFTIFIPQILFADQGVKISCVNMKNLLDQSYKIHKFKFDVTTFQYFDEKQNKFIIIPSKELEFGEDRFTVKFPEYELGFQRIFFEGQTEPTITMSKYDYKNDKFLDHYECDLKKEFIN